MVKNRIKHLVEPWVLFDRQGRPITSQQFCELNKKDDYRHIGYDVLKWGGVVSTVWLGVSYNFNLDGPPIIFESMVFSKAPSEKSGQFGRALYQTRYSTLADAKAGHRKLVEWWKNGPRKT